MMLVLLESHEGGLGRRLGFWVCCAKGALFWARQGIVEPAAADERRTAAGTAVSRWRRAVFPVPDYA